MEKCGVMSLALFSCELGSIAVKPDLAIVSRESYIGFYADDGKLGKLVVSMPGFSKRVLHQHRWFRHGGMSASAPDIVNKINT